MENKRKLFKVPQLSSYDNYDGLNLFGENEDNNEQNETEQSTFDRFERVFRVHCHTAIRSVRMIGSELILAINGLSLVSASIDQHFEEASNAEITPTDFGVKVSKHLSHSIYFMDVWTHQERNVSILVCAGANTTLMMIDKDAGAFQIEAQTNWIKGLCVWNSYVLVSGQNSESPIKVFKVYLKDEQEHKKQLEEFLKNQSTEPPSTWGFRKEASPPSLVERMECVGSFKPFSVEGALLGRNDQIWVGGRNAIQVWKASIENDVPVFKPQFLQMDFKDGIAKSLCAWKDVVASASWNVHLWDPSTGQHLGVLSHKLPVQALSVWGSLLATGSDDHLIRLWNLKYECVAELKGHTGYIRSLCTHKGYLLSSADDQCLCAWEDHFSWSHVRVLFIGWLKNSPLECPFALLPKDLFHYILHDLYSNNGQMYRILYDDWSSYFEDSDSGYA